jgi:CO dehydrogenase maturation factor
VDAECDLIIGVIDPTYESILLAEKMEDMAKSAGKDIVYILNKAGDHIIDHMTKHIDSRKVWAAIPQNEDIFTKNLKGDMLELTVPEIDRFCEKIQETGGLL